MTTFDEQQHRIRTDGLARPTEMGEMLRFPNAQVRKLVGERWGLDHPDWETRKRNIESFKRSADYQRYKVYKPRLF